MKHKTQTGDKTHIILKLRASVIVDNETTTVDVDMDLTVEELDYQELFGAVAQAINGKDKVQISRTRKNSEKGAAV